MIDEQLTTRKLMTIVTEAVIEHAVLKDLERLGAHGYTVTNARGKGSRGVRDAGWEANANIRIKVVCELDTAKAIAQHLKVKYYDNYAMIMMLSDVQVMRPDKF